MSAINSLQSLLQMPDKLSAQANTETRDDPENESFHDSLKNAVGRVQASQNNKGAKAVEPERDEASNKDSIPIKKSKPKDADEKKGEIFSLAQITSLEIIEDRFTLKLDAGELGEITIEGDTKDLLALIEKLNGDIMPGEELLERFEALKEILTTQELSDRTANSLVQEIELSSNEKTLVPKEIVEKVLLQASGTGKEKVSEQELLRRLADQEKKDTPKNLEFHFEKLVKKTGANLAPSLKPLLDTTFQDVLGEFDQLKSKNTGTSESVITVTRDVSTDMTGQADSSQATKADELTNLSREERSALFNRISRSLQGQLRAGAKTIQIRLVPENLGALKIDLQFEGKEVKIVLTTTSRQANHAVQSEVSHLKQTLQDQGIVIQELSVEVDPDGQNKQEGREHSSKPENKETEKSFREEIENILNGDS